MSKENIIEQKLQEIERATLAIATELNWFTPTKIKDVPDQPGRKRIVPYDRVLPDAREHQIQVDKGLGFVVSQVCYGKLGRVFDVFLKALDYTGLKPASYDAFIKEFRSLCNRFPFEFEDQK